MNGKKSTVMQKSSVRPACPELCRRELRRRTPRGFRQRLPRSLPFHSSLFGIGLVFGRGFGKGGQSDAIGFNAEQTCVR